MARIPPYSPPQRIDRAASPTFVGLTLSSLAVAGLLATSAQGALGPVPVKTANTVYAGPLTGASAVPDFRALVIADLPFAGSASGIATLDSGGKIPSAQMPSISITETYVVASQAAMLALSAERGDVAIRSDLNKSYILATDSPTTLADWKELLSPTDSVTSVAGLTGTISATSLTAALNIFGADAGAGGVKGLVPATVSGDATKYLRGDATWATVNIAAYLPLAGGIMTGALLFTDATYDIGASGATRPRNLWATGNIALGGALAVGDGGGATPKGGAYATTSSAGTYWFFGKADYSNVNVGIGSLASSIPGIFISNVANFGWVAGTPEGASALDTSISRVSAGVVQIGTTINTANGSLNLTNLTASGAATAATLALGGATIGTHALAVTGTVDISSNATAAIFFASQYVRGGNVYLNATANGIEASSNTGFLALGAAADVFLSRSAAGIFQVGTANGNALGSLNLTNLTATGNITLGTGGYLRWGVVSLLTSNVDGTFSFADSAFSKAFYLTVPTNGVLQLGYPASASAANAQTLQAQGSSGNSAAEALFTIAGSDQTGTTTTGGGVKIRGGNGTSVGGTVEIWTSATTTPAVALTIAADKSATFAGLATFSGNLSTTANLFIGSAYNVSSVILSPSYGGVRVSNSYTFSWASSISNASADAQTTIGSPAAATFQLGAASGAGAAVAQTLQAQGSSGNSAAAALFTIAGSDQTGTTTTGGGVKIRGGNGTSAGGTVEIWTSATTTPAVALTIAASKIATFAASVNVANNVNITDNLFIGVFGAATQALGSSYGGLALNITGNVVWASTTDASLGAKDLYLTRAAAATLQLGAVTSATAAVAQTLQAQGSSGNSAAAALFTIAGSDQTGTTTTGGGIKIRGGNGTSVGGTVEIWTSATTTPALALTIGADKNFTFVGGAGLQFGTSVRLWDMGSNNIIAVGTTTNNSLGSISLTNVYVASGGAIALADNTAHLYSTGAANFQLGLASSATAAIAQTLQAQGSSGNSAAAALFTIAGSDQSGTTTTGGGVKIRGGNGTSAGGSVEIWTSATTTPAVALTIGADKAATFAGTIDAGANIIKTTGQVWGTGFYTVAGLQIFSTSGNVFTGKSIINMETGAGVWTNTAIPANGETGKLFNFSSTAAFGIYFGSGAPSVSASKGSLYLRSDGSGVSDRMYVNTDGSTAWTAVTTVG